MNNKKQWLFAKKQKRVNSLSVRPKTQSGRNTSSSTLYLTCAKTPLEVFIDCLVDGYYEGLIISGNPNEEELKEAWNNIYLEYCSLMQENQHNEVFELIKEINSLNAKITLVDTCVRHLAYNFDQQIVDILNELRLRCNLLETDQGEKLLKKLDGVISRAKKWLVEIQVAEAKLQTLQEKDKENNPREYFYDMLMVISKQNGYHAKSSDITVYEFCRHIKKLNEKFQRELVKNNA